MILFETGWEFSVFNLGRRQQRLCCIAGIFIYVWCKKLFSSDLTVHADYRSLRLKCSNC